ncbi:MAG TPA: DNA-3-methyladenine glycosylase [Polyangia bacterium]|nr:DNA-3-methyladenine glycosylase [Polyangia bacterium]
MPAALAPPPLPRAFYARPTVAVARDLLGKVLVRRLGRRTVRARIVEVEAYLGERDLASHARNGPTPRSAIMFGPPGFLYVYFIYGMHHCMNFVTETDGVAGAVLIRAAEPLGGGGHPADLRGPAKLCDGLGITLADKGTDLTRADAGLVVVDDGHVVARVARSPRVGVDYAGRWAARLLRFYVPGNASVSGPRPRPRAAAKLK